MVFLARLTESAYCSRTAVRNASSSIDTTVPSGGLPRTGSNVARTLLVAGSLIAFGLLLQGMSRRRRL